MKTDTAIPAWTCEMHRLTTRGDCPKCDDELIALTEAEAATIQAVPRPRGILSDDQRHNIDQLRFRLDAVQAGYRKAITDALASGASFSEVSKATGLSTNTLQRWKREAGK